MKYNKTTNNYLSIFLTFIFMCMVSTVFNKEIYAETLDYEVIQQSKARFDFFQGVGLLNAGFVAESLTAFQRAISIDNIALYQYMYARANQSYGLNATTNSIYKNLIANNFEETFLQSQLEIMQKYALTIPFSQSIENLIRAVSIDLTSYGYQLPMNIRILPNGDIVLVFLQSNDILVMSPTGRIKLELTTGILPTLNPTDVLFSKDKNYLVSSFSSDDITIFSEKGVQTGSFIKDKDANGNVLPFMSKFSGPQFLAEDTEKNIFVSAYGSALIFKFNSNGEYIQDFGIAIDDFIGLENPTGIEVIQDKIIVADYHLINNLPTTTLHTFDLSGNYIDSSTIFTKRIETIRKMNEKELLITTLDSLYIYDVSRNIITQRFFQEDFSRLTSATFDKNNLLWVIDQGRNRLEAFSYLGNQYSGLDTSILAINTLNFPDISVDFTINNFFGTPLVGLEKENFLLFENYNTVDTSKIIDYTQIHATRENIIIIPSIDTIIENVNYQNIQDVIVELLKKNDIATLSQEKQALFWLLETGKLPKYSVKEHSFPKLFIENLSKYSPLKSEAQYLPLTFRFAINTLLLQDGTKMIIFIGKPPNFQSKHAWQWEQIQNILEHHRISFVWINSTNILDNRNKYFSNLMSSNKKIARIYTYYDMYEKNTIKDMFLNNFENIYKINFTSNLPQNFDNNYVPIEIEVNFYSQNGKDISGYVIPGWK